MAGVVLPLLPESNPGNATENIQQNAPANGSPAITAKAQPGISQEACRIEDEKLYSGILKRVEMTNDITGADFKIAPEGNQQKIRFFPGIPPKSYTFNNVVIIATDAAAHESDWKEQRRKGCPMNTSGEAVRSLNDLSAYYREQFELNRVKEVQSFGHSPSIMKTARSPDMKI